MADFGLVSTIVEGVSSEIERFLGDSRDQAIAIANLSITRINRLIDSGAPVEEYQELARNIAVQTMQSAAIAQLDLEEATRSALKRSLSSFLTGVGTVLSAIS